MAIIDVTTYNGETDIWDIHYNVLKGYVDEFVVVEFDQTFSGNPKQPSFPIDKYPDVTYRFHTSDLYEKYREMAEQSPNTVGAQHWKLEFAQKESIKDALTHLKDDDVVFIGDCDEIWESSCASQFSQIGGPFKLSLRVYAYWLNNRSNEIFAGTLLSYYKDIKRQCLNHLRSDSPHSLQERGWHFTSMGGYEALKKKLSDSYTRESYWTEDVESSLEANLASGRDFLGRPFTYTISEEDWPQYLKDNKDKYRHLLKL